MGVKRLKSTLNEFGSNSDVYWTDTELEQFYKLFRKGAPLPKDAVLHANSVNKLSKKYHLKGIEFGNWTTNEDRFNYLATLFICLNDLNFILKFKDYNIGLDQALGISLGARGSGGALAHYEPHNDVINITRYKRQDKLINAMKNSPFVHPDDIPTEIPKAERFVFTGGVGSFAHEYGHFLDYYFGGHYEQVKGSFPLTSGDSTDKTKIDYPEKLKMRNIVEEILNIAFWKKYRKGENWDGTKPKKYRYRVEEGGFAENYGSIASAYILRVEKYAGEKRPYWYQRNEIFARLFEQYIGHKLYEAKRINIFLHKSNQKYDKVVYMNPSELKKVIPLFDKLIKEMRTYF